jgi:uncharacterized membrane protein YfcA
VDADIVLGFLTGIFIAMITAPVGVSGAVFLLPLQLNVSHVANPAVTPTNLPTTSSLVPAHSAGTAATGHSQDRSPGCCWPGLCPA